MSNHPSTRAGLGYAPLRIAATYAVIGLLWIWLSDSILNLLGFNSDHIFLAGAVKGTVFVGLTAGLIYWLVHREVAVAQRSETLLRAVVDGTSDAVFVKDVQGRYLLANDAAAKFLGLSVSQMLGRNDLELIDNATAKKVMENDQTVIAAGNAISITSPRTRSHQGRPRATGTGHHEPGRERQRCHADRWEIDLITGPDADGISTRGIGEGPLLHITAALQRETSVSHAGVVTWKNVSKIACPI